MGDKGARRTKQELLLAELEGIRDTYRLDVKQFIGFVRERKLLIVDGFKKYAGWLEGAHDGRSYSPSTINRKLAAAKSRVRYAFKRSTLAADLRRKYQLEEVLKSVKLKKVDVIGAGSVKVLDIEEARKLITHTKDTTIRLMVAFLVCTGVRVSEMLGIKLDDVGETMNGLVPIRVRGKGGKERTIHVKADFAERIRRHFEGKTHLFEHDGRPYSRISVTNRIKHCALRLLGKEVTAQQLRRTWAAIQIRSGKGVNAVAAVLGNSHHGLAALYPEAALKPEESFLDLDKSEDAGLPPKQKPPQQNS
jgi:integrase